RAEASRTAGTAEDEPKAKKGGRRWYHWVFDGALLAFAVYFVKVRFFSKEPEAPAAKAPVASVSASASASAAPSVMTKASAEVRLGPGQPFAVVETVPPNTAVEVLEVSTGGFVKIKVPSGKTGWVPSDSIVTGR
ncbi:MAG: SH3 domain-containing protein, partial [Polyangiales bacterium]